MMMKSLPASRDEVASECMVAGNSRSETRSVPMSESPFGKAGNVRTRFEDAYHSPPPRAREIHANANTRKQMEGIQCWNMDSGTTAPAISEEQRNCGLVMGENGATCITSTATLYRLGIDTPNDLRTAETWAAKAQTLSLHFDLSLFNKILQLPPSIFYWL